MSVTASSATPELAVPEPAPAQEPQPGPVEVCFDAAPDCYRHWRLRFDGDVAWLLLDVDEQGGIVPGYELKLNSYDLGVDIELYDAVQRLRFSHPEVRSVVLTSGYELALACDEIVLADDGSSAVALPELPLLGVLPGTGGLTRVANTSARSL